MGRLLPSPLMTPHYSFCFVLLLFFIIHPILHKVFLLLFWIICGSKKKKKGPGSSPVMEGFLAKFIFSGRMFGWQIIVLEDAISGIGTWA